jgi:hypothetical protein
LIGILLGSAIVYLEEYAQPFDVVPFPGPGQYVRLGAHIRLRGTYYVEAALPTRGEPLGLDMEEPIPCDLSITVKRNATVVSTQRVTSIVRRAQIGFAHTDLYGVGGDFKLPAGDYSVAFEGTGRCAQAAERGATLTVEETGDPTADVILLQALHALALFLLFGGTLALIALEFIRRPNNRWRGP